VGDNLQAFRRSFAPRSGVAGFTVIELMVTVMCAAILAAVAVPSFQSTINNGRLATASNELLASLQVARMEAIRFNHRTIVCLSTNPTAANPSCAAANATNATGWITFVDTNRNGAYNSGTDKLMRVSTAPAKVRLLGSSNITNKVAVTFRADGFARNTTNDTYTGAFAVCMNTKRPEQNVRRVLVGVGGGISVERAGVGDGQCNEPGN